MLLPVSVHVHIVWWERGRACSVNMALTSKLAGEQFHISIGCGSV